MSDLKPPSQISIEQVRELAEHIMLDMKSAKDLQVTPFSHVGLNVRRWFTEYEYSIYTEAYNAGYDDGDVHGFDNALGGSDECGGREERSVS